MKQFNTTLRTMAMISLMAMVLIAQSGTPLWAATPAPLSSKTPTALTSASLLVNAENAFRSGRYDQAVTVLRQLLARETDSPSAWARYERAVLAAAGDAYLQAVPKNRLRINMADFVNGLKTDNGNIFLLDVREPWEFARGNIPGSVNIPFRKVFNQLDQLPGPESGKRLILICQTQHRANHVLVTLREAGYNNAFTLRGGYSSYIAYQRRLRVGGTTTTGAAAPPAEGAVKTATPATVSATSAAGKPVNNDAALALKEGRFDLAVDILQQALQQDTTSTELWAQYDRALLVRAGARYLRTVPDNRYRVDIDDFVTRYRTHDRRFFLVDVREPDEFARGHIKGSINIPFRLLLQRLNRLPQKDSSQTLLLISRHQRRAIYDLVLLREMGYDNAFTLHGGFKPFLHWMRKLPALEGVSIPGFNQPADGDEMDDEEDFGC